jgi:HJR/Mrr/RecB family endonuclease
MAIDVSEDPGASLFTHALKHRSSRLIQNSGTHIPNNMMFMQNYRYLNSHSRKNLKSHKNFSICVHFLQTAQKENKRKEKSSMD